MSNLYFVQLIGVLLTVFGMIALTASSYLYGKPLSRKEKRGTGRNNSNVRRVPINLETIASAAFFLGGMGILTLSKFNFCAFLAYWLPSLPDAVRFILACK